MPQVFLPEAVFSSIPNPTMTAILKSTVPSSLSRKPSRPIVRVARRSSVIPIDVGPGRLCKPKPKKRIKHSSAYSMAKAAAARSDTTFSRWKLAMRAFASCRFARGLCILQFSKGSYQGTMARVLQVSVLSTPIGRSYGPRCRGNRRHATFPIVLLGHGRRFGMSMGVNGGGAINSVFVRRYSNHEAGFMGSRQKTMRFDVQAVCTVATVRVTSDPHKHSDDAIRHARKLPVSALEAASHLDAGLIRVDWTFNAPRPKFPDWKAPIRTIPSAQLQSATHLPIQEFDRLEFSASV